MNKTIVHIKFNKVVLGGYLFEEILIGRQKIAEMNTLTVICRSDKRYPHMVKALDHTHIEEFGKAKSVFSFELGGIVTEESLEELIAIYKAVQFTFNSNELNHDAAIEELKLEIITRTIQTIIL